MNTTYPSPSVEGPYATYFSKDITLLGGRSGEFQNLTSRLIERAMAYGMEVNTEKNKIMTNSMNNISADISMNGQKRRGLLSGSWEQPCAKMAPALQWQQWPD